MAEIGGILDQIPEFLLHEIGASFIWALSFRLSPPQILALFSAPVREILGQKEEFSALFSNLYGSDWEKFLADWRDWILSKLPPLGAELVYEEQRLGIDLRASFLWPLLSPEEREEIGRICRAIRRGKGDLGGASAGGILRAAWAEPSEEIIAALDARTLSSRDWAQLISGPQLGFPPYGRTRPPGALP